MRWRARSGARFLFTERDAATKEMALRRGFTVTPGETAVVIEDVITTGGSTQDVVEVLRVAGRGCDRPRDRSSIAAADTRTSACREWRWLPCRWQRTSRTSVRICRAGIPVVKPGSRPA